MDDATLAALRTAADAVFDVGFAALLGALAMLALLRDSPSDWAAQGRQRCRRLLVLASLVALLAELAWMEVQAVAMTELSPVAALLAAGGVVVDTRFGRAWAVATLALAACAALAVLFRHRDAPLRRLALASTIVAAAHASAGHAGANGLVWFEGVMTLHVVATGLWAGSVFAAALALLQARPAADEGVRYATRLSTLATGALAGVLLTGVASAWHGLGGTLAALAPATATGWGLVLDVKLALVALAVALGGFNRVVVMKALPASWPCFARVLRLEAVVLLAALVAAALLANSEPPAV